MNNIDCTKTYKYNRKILMTYLKDLWGETIEKVAILFVLAMAVFSAPAMASSAAVGTDGVDILGDGIFETEGSAFKLPCAADTNFDSVDVGNDKALAFGWYAKDYATAENNLEIKKNQDTGDCSCCAALDPTAQPCEDCCIKYNVEQIEVGDRSAQAFGFATAKNNVKIVTNQQ